MKKLMVVLVLLLFFLSCEKEKLDPKDPLDDTVYVQYKIQGKISDLKTGDPKAGLITYILTQHQDIYGRLYTTIHSSDTADADGLFEITFKLSSTFDIQSFPLRIALSKLPENYQHCGFVDGHLAPSLESNYTASIYQNYYPVEDGGFYDIQLMPVSYIQMFKPNIPSEWQNADIILDIDNLGTQDLTYTAFIFKLNEEWAWDLLSQAFPLVCGTEINGEFTIKNGTATKIGFFNKNVALGDTTGFVLPLFP